MRRWARAGWRTTRRYLLLNLIVVSNSNHLDGWRRLDVRSSICRKTVFDSNLHLLHSTLATSRILLEGKLLRLATLANDSDWVAEAQIDVRQILKDKSEELSLTADLKDDITGILWRRLLLNMKYNKVILQRTQRDTSQVGAQINAVPASVDERL